MQTENCDFLFVQTQGLVNKVALSHEVLFFFQCYNNAITLKISGTDQCKRTEKTDIKHWYTGETPTVVAHINQMKRCICLI